MSGDPDAALTALFRDLTRALIEATPGHWSEATLRVEAELPPEGDPRLSFDIRSKGHPRELVEETDDVRAAVRALEAYERRAGRPWSSMAFKIAEEGGRWRFTSAFEPVGLLDSPH